MRQSRAEKIAVLRKKMDHQQWKWEKALAAARLAGRKMDAEFDAFQKLRGQMYRLENPRPRKRV